MTKPFVVIRLERTKVKSSSASIFRSSVISTVIVCVFTKSVNCIVPVAAVKSVASAVPMFVAKSIEIVSPTGMSPV